MDSDSENEFQGERRWKQRNISANHSATSKNVALKSFEPPNYVTLKEEYEEGDLNCDNCKRYKEKADNLQRSLDNALQEKDKHELRGKALESEMQVLKDSNSVCRQAVQTVDRSLSRVNEDLQRQKLTVSHQKMDLQTARNDLKEKEKRLRDIKEELQKEHKITCQLQAQLIMLETPKEQGEWQKKQRQLEEEKEEVLTTNTALQADIVDLLKQKKHDKEVIDVLLDQLDERNEKVSSSASEEHQRSILVLGDANAYEIGQILEREYPISAQFEAFHHTRQLVDYAESCPSVLAKSDQILIHVGTTDVTRGLTATQIRNDIEKAVYRISQQSTTPIFITTIPPIKTHVKYDIEVRRLNRYLTEIEKVTVLDIYEDTAPNLAGDGYHLTNSSIEQVVASLADKMQLVITTELAEQNQTRADIPPRSETNWKSPQKRRSQFKDDESEDNQSQTTNRSGRSPERSEHSGDRGQSPEKSESAHQRQQSPERSQHTDDRIKSSERSERANQRQERSETTGQRERSLERSENEAPDGACYNDKWEEPRKETRLLIRVRQEDMSHIIGKHHQNQNRLIEEYRVDIKCMANGKVIIVGDMQNAENAARDIERTIDNLYKFRERDSMRKHIAPRFS